MLKVLFISNYPSPYRVDFWNLLGNHVDLTVSFSATPEVQLHRSEKWFNLDYSGFNAVFLKKRIRCLGLEICLDIIDVLRSPFDYVIVGGYSNGTQMLAIEYMSAHHIPFIMEADGGLIQNDSKLKHTIKRHFISAADAWMSSGKPTTDYFIHYGAKPEKIYNYHFTSQFKKDIDNAHRLSRKEKDDLRHRLGMNEKRIVISVGRFSYKQGYGKGYDTLCEVATIMPLEIGFYIIGDEPTEQFVNVQKSLPHVHFIGFKKKDELEDYYAAADVFVLLTRGDVWGLVINEAMSFGLPVITTDKCGAGLSLIKDGFNGYIVPVNEAEAAASKLDLLLNDPGLLHEMGNLNYESIQEYTIENMVEEHLNTFTKLGGGKVPSKTKQV